MWEMIMIFLVVLLLFGAKRLPEIGSSLGKGIREFKGSIREIEKEVKAVDDEPERGAVPSPSDASDESDEGPRRLTTSPGPSSGQSHPGGVPTSEDAPQSGGEGAAPEPAGSEAEGLGAQESESEGSDAGSEEEEEAPTG
jgi:sec-independent protein translocase protein TatA